MRKLKWIFPAHISHHTSTLIFLDMFLKAKLLVKGYILRVYNFWFLFINFHLNRFYLIYTHNKPFYHTQTIPNVYYQSLNFWWPNVFSLIFISDVGHTCINILFISITLGNYLIKFFAHFSIWLFILFLVIEKCSLQLRIYSVIYFKYIFPDCSLWICSWCLLVYSNLILSNQISQLSQK